VSFVARWPHRVPSHRELTVLIRADVGLRRGQEDNRQDAKVSSGLSSAVSRFLIGDLVFHQKFGNGNVTHVEGNKLTIAFDRAGEKKVVDSVVARV
jgi:hypothetical protein